MRTTLLATSFLGAASLWVVGAFELAGNAWLHRSVTGEPRPWASTRQMFRRREQLRELMAPALVAFGASAACNIGTSLLLSDLADGRSWWRGVVWLFAGLVAVLVALAAIIGAPIRERWDLVRSYETLLVDMREATHGNLDATDVDRFRTRLIELDRGDLEANTRRRAATTLFAVPPTLVGDRPRFGFRALRSDAGTWGPTHRAVGAWALRKRRGMCAYVTLMIAVWAVTMVTAAFGEVAPFATTIAALCVGIVLWFGTTLTFLGIRSDLMWWSRVDAENQTFRRAATDALGAMLSLGQSTLPALAAEPAPILSIGRWVLTKRRRQAATTLSGNMTTGHAGRSLADDASGRHAVATLAHTGGRGTGRTGPRGSTA